MVDVPMETTNGGEGGPKPKDDQSIVTPYAFQIADDLLGVKLAKPWKRLAAILIDLLIVVILTSTLGVGATFLALFILYKIKFENKDGNSPWYIKLVKGFVFLVLFLVILIIGAAFYFSELTDEEQAYWGETFSLVKGGFSGVGAMLEFQTCENELCRQESIDKAVLFFEKSGLPKHEAANAIMDVVTDSALTDDELAASIAYVDQKMEAYTPSDRKPITVKDGEVSITEDWDSVTNENEKEKSQPSVESLEGVQSKNGIDDNEQTEQEIAKIGEEIRDSINEKSDQQKVDSADEKVGLLAWLESIFVDLGLSVTWTAVYFTLLTTYWKGQTVGKRLFGLRVVSITNEPISVWDSFGRYGGYGAGLATGLLGFLQVYWDSNRQAIQDKISETLVIES